MSPRKLPREEQLLPPASVLFVQGQDASIITLLPQQSLPVIPAGWWDLRIAFGFPAATASGQPGKGFQHCGLRSFLA